MSFNAKALLEKHGWKKGEGLGKGRQGMKESVKIKMKPNKNGLGYSIGEQFTYNWWDHAYNEAAKKLTVITTEEGSVKLENHEVETDLKVKKKKKNSKKESLSNNKYNYFVQKGTYKEGEHILNEDNSDDNESSEIEDSLGTISNLTTEELFEACGRMTAHKAARHGLTLKGKLSRVEAQEKKFMDKLKNRKENKTENNCLNDKSKKANKRKLYDNDTMCYEEIANQLPENELLENGKVKKKCKNKSKSYNLIES